MIFVQPCSPNAHLPISKIRPPACRLNLVGEYGVID
jgi:hypothetical protein